MDDRELKSKKMRDHYEQVWRAGDPWDFEASALDAERYARQAALIGGRRYGRVIDTGCGSGHFTRRLAGVSDEVLALDIAPSAVERARSHCAGCNNVTFRACNVMDFDPVAEGPWDLVVMSEAIYCLGWQYPLFDIGWLISNFRQSLSDNGRFLLVNTLGHDEDYLLLPWLIATYADLFVNIGYKVEAEEHFTGEKHGVTFEILMTLFSRGIESTT